MNSSSTHDYRKKRLMVVCLFFWATTTLNRIVVFWTFPFLMMLKTTFLKIFLSWVFYLDYSDFDRHQSHSDFFGEVGKKLGAWRYLKFEQAVSYVLSFGFVWFVCKELRFSLYKAFCDQLFPSQSIGENFEWNNTKLNATISTDSSARHFGNFQLNVQPCFLLLLFSLQNSVLGSYEIAPEWIRQTIWITWK